jgi:hypothetical protein
MALTRNKFGFQFDISETISQYGKLRDAEEFELYIGNTDGNCFISTDTINFIY